MSDTVQLALIAMFQSWGLAIIDHGPAIVMAMGSVVVTIGGWWIGHRVKKQGEAIVEQVYAVKAAAVTSSEQAALMAKGAERAGVEKGVDIGVEKERKRASQPATLRADFQPESTDVFMARTDGSDQNDQR